jgi:hypothetical protein
MHLQILNSVRLLLRYTGLQQQLLLMSNAYSQLSMCLIWTASSTDDKLTSQTQSHHDNGIAAQR